MQFGFVTALAFDENRDGFSDVVRAKSAESASGLPDKQEDYCFVDALSGHFLPVVPFHLLLAFAAHLAVDSGSGFPGRKLLAVSSRRFSGGAAF